MKQLTKQPKEKIWQNPFHDRLLQLDLIIAVHSDLFISVVK